MTSKSRIGVGVVGFGWMGQAHSRSVRRLAGIFPGEPYYVELVACSDTDAGRREQAVSDFGFARGEADWQSLAADPDIDVVFITTPNALHVELVEAFSAAGKHVFCEKPVGGTPEQTARAELAARKAGVISAVGYNYRWAPMVQEAKRLINDGVLGRITNYRGRFFSTYGADPSGLLTWRYLVDEGGYGVSSDLLSHSVDLGLYLLGPIARVVGTTATFIPERPLPSAGAVSHYGHGRPGDPTGAVTNEDYVGMLVEFEDGVRGSFESSRTMVGPESQMAFEVYGTEGALAWNLERMNELQLYLRSDGRYAGYRTIFGGERFPYHGNFVPGNANGIGFEDLVLIEDLELMRSIAEKRPFQPGFEDAVRYVSVQDALLRSVASGAWEPVKTERSE